MIKGMRILLKKLVRISCSLRRKVSAVHLSKNLNDLLHRIGKLIDLFACVVKRE